MRRSLLATLALLAPATLAAQESHALVTLLGDDTIAVERITRTDGRIRAEVLVRSPRTTLRVYEYTPAVAGVPARLRSATYDPATGTSGTPLTTAEAELGGAGIPFIDLVHWPFELMAERARTAALDTLTLALAAGSRTLPFAMARLGAGRISARHPTRGTMTLRIDAQGRMVALDAAGTTRAVRVLRTPGADVPALARDFAARPPLGELSGRGSAEATIGTAEIEVDYGRPLKRGREIFGALVPYGRVWRTGANQATHFSTSAPLRIGDATLPAGRYTLFTIPEADGWTLLVNRRVDINGQAYDAEHDVLRLPMRLRRLDDTVESFTIRVEETAPGRGELKLQWDRTEAYLPFTVAR